MKISQAIKNYLAYQKLNSKKTPFKTQDYLLAGRFMTLQGPIFSSQRSLLASS